MVTLDVRGIGGDISAGRLLRLYCATDAVDIDRQGRRSKGTPRRCPRGTLWAKMARYAHPF